MLKGQADKKNLALIKESMVLQNPLWISISLCNGYFSFKSIWELTNKINAVMENEYPNM